MLTIDLENYLLVVMIITRKKRRRRMIFRIFLILLSELKCMLAGVRSASCYCLYKKFPRATIMVILIQTCIGCTPEYTFESKMAVSKLNYIIIEDDSEMKRKESWRGGAGQ